MIAKEIMHSMKIKNKKDNKKTIVAILIVVLLVACATAFYVYAKSTPKNESEPSLSSSDTSTEKSSKNTASPTDNNQPYPEDEKDKTNTDPQAPTSTDTQTGKTTVSIVSSVTVSDGFVYIRGGINNTVDTSGTCFALLKSQSGATIKKDTTLLPSASTTDCKTIKIPLSELSTGKWTYTLNYSSTNTEGISSENTFNIQ